MRALSLVLVGLVCCASKADFVFFPCQPVVPCPVIYCQPILHCPVIIPCQPVIPICNPVLIETVGCEGEVVIAEDINPSIYSDIPTGHNSYFGSGGIVNIGPNTPFGGGTFGGFSGGFGGGFGGFGEGLVINRFIPFSPPGINLPTTNSNNPTFVTFPIPQSFPQQKPDFFTDNYSPPIRFPETPIAVVPEPSSIIMILIGFITLFIRRLF